jgi:hypothetical protein
MSVQSDMKPVLEDIESVVECTLYRTQQSEFGRKLESFVGEMSSMAPGKIRVSRESNDSILSGSPCFRIGREKAFSIVYAALPLGFQLSPFLKALRLVAGHETPAASEPASIDDAAEIMVVISENCPHCPKVVDAAIVVARQHPSISLCIVDALQNPDVVKEYRFRSVPATIVDGRLVLVGNTTADRLLELINIRGTREFEMEVVLSLIEARRISEAAECLDGDAGRQVILTLVQDPDLSKRMSALVVIEKALENKPDAVRAMAPSFAELLSNHDARIRGDVADLLGKLGDARMIARLEPLTSDPDPDVAEIAAEAIAELQKGGN